MPHKSLARNDLKRLTNPNLPENRRAWIQSLRRQIKCHALTDESDRILGAAEAEIDALCDSRDEYRLWRVLQRRIVPAILRVAKAGRASYQLSLSLEVSHWCEESKVFDPPINHILLFAISAVLMRASGVDICPTIYNIAGYAEYLRVHHGYPFQLVFCHQTPVPWTALIVRKTPPKRRGLVWSCFGYLSGVVREDLVHYLRSDSCLSPCAERDAGDDPVIRDLLDVCLST